MTSILYSVSSASAELDPLSSVAAERKRANRSFTSPLGQMTPAAFNPTPLVCTSAASPRPAIAAGSSASPFWVATALRPELCPRIPDLRRRIVPLRSNWFHLVPLRSSYLDHLFLRKQRRHSGFSGKAHFNQLPAKFFPVTANGQCASPLRSSDDAAPSQCLPPVPVIVVAFVFLCSDSRLSRAQNAAESSANPRNTAFRRFPSLPLVLFTPRRHDSTFRTSLEIGPRNSTTYCPRCAQKHPASSASRSPPLPERDILRQPEPPS